MLSGANSYFKSKPARLLIEKRQQNSYANTKFLRVFTVAKNFKIKLAAIAKDEGFYLPLWVYHHLHFGFDVLDIRVNDTTDNSLQILEKLKVIYGERLRFSLADQEMAACRAKDINFQAYIYTQIHQETLKEDFTHLMFLDIDEYWCAANFTETIKDFLAAHADFDVCMFQWLMDIPDAERGIGDFPFKLVTLGQKSDHIKSLLNLRAPVERIHIHNYELRSGKYTLPNATTVEFDANNHSRGILPTQLFERGRLTIDRHFIYHQTLRSQDEYLAGLMRGNKQIGDDSLLKTNRFGYINLYADVYIIPWFIDAHALKNYQLAYQVLAASLQVELNQAKLFVLARKTSVLAYLSESIFVQKLHEKKMRGIDQAIYQCKENKYFIKAKTFDVLFDEETLKCSFICEVISGLFNYELIMTQGFSSTPVPATMRLLDEEQRPQRMIKKFKIEIAMVDLSYIVYSKWPPFCLAANIDGSLILLERGQFSFLGKILAPYALKLRTAAIEATATVVPSLSTTKPVNRSSFWQKIFGKT